MGGGIPVPRQVMMLCPAASVERGIVSQGFGGSRGSLCGIAGAGPQQGWAAPRAAFFPRALSGEHRFVLDEDSYLVPELDGVRILSRTSHEFLHEIPGEMAPGGKAEWEPLHPGRQVSPVAHDCAWLCVCGSGLPSPLWGLRRG